MDQDNEIRQTVTGPEDFVICFRVIFGCYDQRFICGRETWE